MVIHCAVESLHGLSTKITATCIVTDNFSIIIISLFLFWGFYICFTSLGWRQRLFDFTGNKIINLPSHCFLPLKYLSSSTINWIKEYSLSSLRNYGRKSIVLKIMYWLYWLPALLSQKCKYSSCWGINLLNLAVYMWLECFRSFLVLQLIIDAITKWHNAKDSKDTEQYPPSQNKSQPTMVSTTARKNTQCFWLPQKPCTPAL